MVQFGVFLAAYTLSQFFRSFLAVIAPDLARDLSLTPTDLGNISSAWFALFAVCQLPVGVALDRIGPRRTVSVVMLAAAAGAALLAFAMTANQCILAMALIGVGCSPVYMGGLYVFARTFPAHRFAFLSSWLIGIGSAGNLIAATPLAWAASRLGWRASFLTIAGVTVAAAVIVALFARDPPRADTAALGKSQGAARELMTIIGIRDLWPLIPLITVSYAIIVAERGLWIGPYLADVWGLEAVERGHVALLMGLAMSAGALAYGPLDHWLGTRKWVVFTGSIVTVAGLVALWAVPKPGLGTATAILCLVGGAGISYAVLMAHARPLFPEHLIGRGITFANFLFIGGAAVLQPLSGAYVHALKQAGLEAPEVYARLHLAFAVVLLAATAVYTLSREKR